jgi:hypothetical protein
VTAASTRQTTALTRAMIQLARRDPRMRAEWLATRRFCGEQLERFVVSRSFESPVPDPGRAAQRMHRIVTAVFEQLVLIEPFPSVVEADEAQVVLEKDRGSEVEAATDTVDELVAVALAVLGLDPADR